MDKSLEKSLKRYVICSLDQAGNVVYLHSLHEYKWELTTDVERASKAVNRRTAQMILENYQYDTHSKYEWIIVPLNIEYYLINES